MVNVTHFDEPRVRYMGKESTTIPKTSYLPREEHAVEIDTSVFAAMICADV